MSVFLLVSLTGYGKTSLSEVRYYADTFNSLYSIDGRQCVVKLFGTIGLSNYAGDREDLFLGILQKASAEN